MSNPIPEPIPKCQGIQTQQCSPAMRSHHIVDNPEQTKESFNQFKKVVQNAHRTNDLLNPKASETEKKMFEHSLIREIMQKSKARTIYHSINEISPKTQLYVSPIKLKKQSIDSKEGPYASQCSKKVTQIYEKLNDRNSLSEKVKEASRRYSSAKKDTNHRLLRPKSADLNLNKRVSASGLVTYNFLSVNAKKSLGYNPSHDNEEMLQSQLSSLRQKNCCTIARAAKIAKRRSVKRVLENEQLKQAVMSDFQTDTNSFLSTLKNQFEQNQQIYGQRLDKLKCIKQYMQQEKVGYEQAEHIVSEIAMASKLPATAKITPRKYVIDEDTQLRMKKRILQDKRIMLRHLHFVE